MMDRRHRRELEEQYTEVGEPIPTDVGRMLRNVGLVRLALMAAIGIPLLLGFICLGLVALFAIVGTSPLLAPEEPTPTPLVRPTPPRSPGGLVPPDVGVRVASTLGQALWRASDGQRPAPAGAPCAREGKMKGLTTTARFPHREGQRRWHRRLAPRAGAVTTARPIVATQQATAVAPAARRRAGS